MTKDHRGVNIINRKTYKPINMMITDADYLVIAHQAARKGMTPTTYCRLLVLGQLDTHQKTGDKK